MPRDTFSPNLSGIPKPGGRVNMIVVATQYPIFILSTNGKAVIRKIMLVSNGSGDCWVRIGTVAAPDMLPRIRLINNMNLTLTEDEIPAIEFNANIQAQTAAIGGSAAVPVEIAVEVEEWR